MWDLRNTISMQYCWAAPWHLSLQMASDPMLSTVLYRWSVSLSQQMGAIRSIHPGPPGQFSVCPTPTSLWRPGWRREGRLPGDTGERNRTPSINCSVANFLTSEECIKKLPWIQEREDGQETNPYIHKALWTHLCRRKDESTEEGTGPLSKKARPLRKKLTEAGAH